MDPVSDSLLLSVAEISATLTGLFLVGVFFYVDSDVRNSPAVDGDVDTYMRAGTRIVLILYAIPLTVPLALAALGSGWGILLFVVLCAVLIVANIDTARQIRTIARQTSSVALVANEAVSTLGVIVLVALPWFLGGWRPTAEHLAPSILIALGAGFLSTCALVIAVFDLRRSNTTA